MNQMLKHSGGYGFQMFPGRLERSDSVYRVGCRQDKSMSAQLGRKLRAVYELPDAQSEPDAIRALLQRIGAALD